jgi:hypothetical protein
MNTKMLFVNMQNERSPAAMSFWNLFMGCLCGDVGCLGVEDMGPEEVGETGLSGPLLFLLQHQCSNLHSSQNSHGMFSICTIQQFNDSIFTYTHTFSVFGHCIFSQAVQTHKMKM